MRKPVAESGRRAQQRFDVIPQPPAQFVAGQVTCTGLPASDPERGAPAAADIEALFTHDAVYYNESFFDSEPARGGWT